MTLLALVICIVLFLLWKLDFIASLLNIKALEPELPESFKDVYDPEKYAKSQRYTCENERVAIIESIASLTLLFVFWFIGGFAHLDDWTRSFGYGPIITGVTFMAIILFAQLLAGLPMSIYKTFVIEEKFGFNKTTPSTFVIDQIKGIILGAVIGLPILALILWIFESVPMAWLWAWVAFTIIQLGLTYIAPVCSFPYSISSNP